MSISNGQPNLPQNAPRALFIQGVADDGLVRITAEMDRATHQQAIAGMNRFSSVSAVSRHILGSLNHFEYVNIPGLTNEVILLVGKANQAFKFNIPQVIVNCIVDPDVAKESLQREQEIIERLEKLYKVTIPVVNPPASILRTTRDKIYEQFHALPGLHIPRAIRIAPESVKDCVQKIKDAGIKLPFLIRNAGTHGGKGLQIISGWDEKELLKLERYGWDGSDYYVTEWTDFKSKDGMYRKARIAMVGGMPIARHQIVADDWNVHSKSREEFMKNNAELRKQEETFTASPVEKSISADALASLEKIYAELGLDYFGVDCSIRPDGSLTIFEINAAVNTMEQGGLDIYPYLAAPVQNIIKAFNDVVSQKATLARAA